MNKLNMRAGEILLLFCLMILKNQHFILSNLIHHFFHTHTGTEVIVLKAIPLTHCEDQVRYFAREKLWSGVPPYVALTYYGVNSVTGIVTVNSGIANLRAIKVRSKYCQRHTLSDSSACKFVC